jgi:hypothetical protein
MSKSGRSSRLQGKHASCPLYHRSHTLPNRAGWLSGNVLDSRSRTSAILTEVILDSPQHLQRSRDSSVGIATSYGLESRVSIPGRDKFVLSTASKPAVQPIQTPIEWVSAAPSPVVNRPGREDDHPPPSCAEIKNP